MGHAQIPVCDTSRCFNDPKNPCCFLFKQHLLCPSYGIGTIRFKISCKEGAASSTTWMLPGPLASQHLSQWIFEGAQISHEQIWAQRDSGYGYVWISMDQQPGTLCLCHVVSRHWRLRKEQSHIIPQLAIYFGGSHHLTQPLEIPAFSAVDSASPLSAKANAFTSRPWWLRNPLKMGIQPAFYRLFQHENYGFHRISLINESMMVGWWWVRGLLV